MMFRISLIIAFVAWANGTVLPQTSQLNGKIVGGLPISINEAPYQVALLREKNGAGAYYLSCGGSIISRTIIVSAAHCVDGTYPIQWRVRAGSTYHNTGGQVIQVTRIIQHSGFNARLDSDISLLFLANSLTLGLTVATIRLPVQGTTIFDGSQAVVTGWGSLREGGSQPTNLYKVVIPTVNQVRCQNAYASFNPVTWNMICAGRIDVGGQDACHGDSGGPLIINGVLIGITSWGKGCAQPGYPGVWTRVPSLRIWIRSNTNI